MSLKQTLYIIKEQSIKRSFNSLRYSIAMWAAEEHRINKLLNTDVIYAWHSFVWLTIKMIREFVIQPNITLNFFIEFNAMETKTIDNQN